MSNDPNSFLTPRFILGVCLAVAGVLLALDRLFILDAGPILRLWPIVLVVIGVAIVARTNRGRSGRLNGVVLIIAGAWLLSNRIGVWHVRFWEFFWPLVLVLIGAKLVLQTVGRRVSAPGDEARTASLFALLGSCKRRWGHSEFGGGELISLMGGCELDLRDAWIAPGGQATVDVFSLMGGFEVRVPEGWVVSSRVTPIMGGVVDETRSNAAAASAYVSGDPIAPPCLVLRGLVIMSSIEIKN